MEQAPVKALLLGIFFFVLNSNTFATKITADQNGNWNNASTWNPDVVPGCYDTIVIPAAFTVTVSVTANLTSCPPVYLLVQGTLFFQSGKKMDLPNGSVVYIAPGGHLNGGGGGGNSNWITIGGSSYWTAGDGNLNGPAILCQSCSLPVDLIAFDAELANDVVKINWATGSELNNDFFLVQRSVDGFNWETIDSADGAGNTSFQTDYYREDRNPLMGISYYRLKQVDLNGAFAFSGIRVISNGNFFTNQQILVLSTQSSSQHNVVIYFSEAITGPVEVSVVSVQGAVIASQTVVLEDDKWVVLPINHSISTGIYVVHANRKIEKSFFQ